MTHSSSRLRKLKQALTQDPATRPTPSQTWSPVPLDGDPRRPVRNFTDPRQLPGMKQLTASDGLTVMMPAVQTAPVADSAPTQILPPIAEELPPSAQHADLAKRTTTFVEDNDLEPASPGRHALNELMSGPDDMQNLASVAQRVINDFGGPDRAAKDPARSVAVRMFRHARDMARTREARCDQDDARLESVDARIKAFAKRWAHNDAHWDEVAKALKAKQETSDAGQLVTAYAAGGTEVALYKVDELSHEITRRALAGSAVAR